MSGIYSLEGQIQHYAWGGDKFIPELLGQGHTEGPNAEYWLGAHDKAPSLVETDQGKIPLNELISQNPESVLGRRVNEHFGRLPFLFKVLDVKESLSIQVHPTKKEAEKGFDRENKEGIALNAPNRNYKDNNHKPEVMVALSEFWLLHGFRKEDSLKGILKAVPELGDLLPVFLKNGYKGLYKQVMEEAPEVTNSRLLPLLNRIKAKYNSGSLEKSNPDYWAAKVSVESETNANIDKGIYSIYFFNLVKVLPGQAVFQDAGIPHAYLEGQNIELMANSDNVLRGGLTPKYVDVPELLKHTRFEGIIPQIMDGEPGKNTAQQYYHCPIPDFLVSKIQISESFSSNTNSAQILLVMEGGGRIESGNDSVKYKKGSSILLLADQEYEIIAENESTFYAASVPV